MGPSLVLLLLFEAFDTAQALVSPHSRPTSPAEALPDGVNGWTPQTTQPPRLLGHGLYGAMTKHDLLKRDSSSSFTGTLATCGWYNGDSDTPLTCEANYGCAYLTQTAPDWFACCPMTSNTIDWSNCPYYSTCYPFDSYSAPNTWTGTYEYAPSGTISFFCPSVQPYCNTIFLTNLDTSTYQHMYCDSTEGNWNVLQTTSGGSSSGSTQSGSSTSKAAPPNISHSPSVQTVTVTKSSPGGGTDRGQLGGSSTAATPTPTGTNKKTNTNVGAIAGGVVGGVAGIALIGAAVGYLIYRKRKARVEPMREVSIYSQNYPNSNGGHSSGYNNGTNY